MGDGQRVGGEGLRSGDKTNKINFILLNSNFTSLKKKIYCLHYFVIFT